MPEVSHQHAVSRYLISMYISHLPLCQVRERHDSGLGCAMSEPCDHDPPSRHQGVKAR
jgi:hypothetical protein